jgi:hypothetical protein
VCLDSVGGISTGEPNLTGPQKTTIRILKGVRDAEDKVTSLSARLGRIARIVYFRNMDVTEEDIEYLSHHLARGSITGEHIARLLVDKKQQLQTKIWASKGFTEWARKPFEQINEAQYLRKSVNKRRTFWDSRVTLKLVEELFKPLHAVTFRLPGKTLSTDGAITFVVSESSFIGLLATTPKNLHTFF